MSSLAPHRANRHREVLQVAIPVTLATLSTPLVGLVDTAVVARIGDPAALGGVAVAGVIANVVIYAFNFLRTSTTGLVAQAIGRGDGAEQVAASLRALSVALGAGLLAVLFRRPLQEAGLALMEVEPAVAGAARDYLSTRALSLPMMLVNFAVLGSLLGERRVRAALLLQLFLNITNMGLAIAFVHGLGWGVAGAGTATALAETATAAAGCLLLWRRARGRLAPALAVYGKAERFRALFRIGADILIRSMCILGAIALFTRIGAGLGTGVLAANVVLMNLFYLSGAFLDGLATAAQQMSGRAYGAGDRRAFLANARLLMGWGLAIGAAVSAAYFAAGNGFIAAMTPDPEIARLARRYFPLTALIPLVGSLTFVLDGVYIGATWTAQARNIMLAAVAIFAVAGEVLAATLGNAGLWLALLLFLAIRGLAQLAWLGRLAGSDRAFPGHHAGERGAL